MPALNFSAQFADAVASGKKCQTIRPYRKRPIHVGDRLVLYTGMRTKRCRKLLETICVEVVGINIAHLALYLNHELVSAWQADDFVRADGFATWAEFVKWFGDHYGLPFEGQVIQWRGVSQ